MRKIFLIWTLIWFLLGIAFGFSIHSLQKDKAPIVIPQADSTSRAIIDSLENKISVYENSSDE